MPMVKVPFMFRDVQVPDDFIAICDDYYQQCLSFDCIYSLSSTPQTIPQQNVMLFVSNVATIPLEYFEQFKHKKLKIYSLLSEDVLVSLFPQFRLVDDLNQILTDWTIEHYPLAQQKSSNFWIIPGFETISPENYNEFAGVFCGFLDQCNLKDSVFVMGEHSNYIGQKLTSIGVSRSRRQSGIPAAVLLIDRDLDLGPCSLLPENIMDAVYTQDPFVPISEFLDEFITDDFNLPLYENKDVIQFITKLLSRSMVDAFTIVQSVISGLVGDVVEAPLSKEQLHYLKSKLQNDHCLLFKNEPMLLYLYSALTALESHSQQTISIQKMLLGALADHDITGCIYQLVDILNRIKNQKSRNEECLVSTRDVLLLTLFVYSAIGDSGMVLEEDEMILQEGFINAMAASSPTVNIKAITAWVRKAFAQLHNVRKARVGLSTTALLNEHGYLPLLEMIAISFGSDRPINDLKYIPYTISNLLTKFLGADPIPSQFKTVVLCVVGGITFQEVYRFQTIMAGYGINTVIVSTGIASRKTMMSQIFKSK